MGPRNLGGNYTTLLRAGNTIYLGLGFGGLYRSRDEGSSWELVSSFVLNRNGEEVYRCPAVTALAADGNILYVGTGNITQYNPSRVLSGAVDTFKSGVIGAFGRPGMGVFVSTDGGQTFTNQNATWRLSYPNMAYNQRTGLIDVVGISVQAGKVAVITPDSLFISTDTLRSYRALRISRVAGPLRSVAWGSDGVLLVGSRDSLYRSTDGGETFQRVTDIPLPEGKSKLAEGGVVVRSAPSNPSIFYMATADDRGRLVGVWLSTDNGASWSLISQAENPAFAVLGGRGTEALALSVDPADPSHIVVGGTQLWEFSPALSWERINPGSPLDFILRLPSPIRDVLFLPNGDLLVAGDGRVVRVTDNRRRLRDATYGIQGATRFLSLALSPLGDIYASGAEPTYLALQYRGDFTGLFRTFNEANFFNSRGFVPPLGNIVVSHRLPEKSFIAYSNGRVKVSEDRGISYSSFYAPPHPSARYKTRLEDSIQPGSIVPPGQPSPLINEDRPYLYGPLYPPIVLLEKFPEVVRNRDGRLQGESHLFIATSQSLWYIHNVAPEEVRPGQQINYWSRIIPQAVSNVSTNHTYSTYLSSSNRVPTAMAVDTAYTLWLGNSGGELYRLPRAHRDTTDRTQRDTLENLTAAIAPLVQGRWISAIAVHPRNPNLLAIAVGSYADPAARIFLSQNATAPTPTFTAIHANLPNVPVYSLYFYPDSSALLFAGTEWGLWRCLDVRNPNWEELTGETVGRIPVTAIGCKLYRYVVDTLDASNPDNPVTQARLVPDPEKPIYIATWGRGIWRLNSFYATALPAGEIPGGLKVNVYPNPFEETITIGLSLPQGAASVQAVLYTLSGQAVTSRTLAEGLGAGHHTLTWSLGGLARGIYLLQLQVQDAKGHRHLHVAKVLRE
ncbi:MAG: T9SS type A sorting domain-containing protein [Bacteroidia bacterium]